MEMPQNRKWHLLWLLFAFQSVKCNYALPLNEYRIESEMANPDRLLPAMHLNATASKRLDAMSVLAAIMSSIPQTILHGPMDTKSKGSSADL
jgi:hypothetical protein